MNEIEPIAIIGIGCRLPGAKTPQGFWQLLRNGVDAITEVPPERWDIDTFYDPSPATSGKMYTRWGGFLEQVDRFEPSFFGISPREAQRLDPQQRLLLEVVWEALENAAIVPESLGRSQTGVFIGISNADYHRLIYKDCSGINAYSGTGTASSIAANRLSYVLNLFGPSVAIDTACSSSLVALHYACQSLLSLESNLCLVGGVNLMLSPEPTITFSQAQMMAADGRCKTFDASADGYVRGEGCGVVVLKRLSDALRDGDNIQAIVRGSAVNQDGLTNGLTAPNGPSQQAVIRKAVEKAGVKPAQISYIEAHGTGTALGDPIEVKSLKAVLMEDRQPDQPCWIGSVKTNIGHLEAAAGIAGLIKVVLSLQHGEIPPQLHFNQLNPYIKIKNTPIKIPTSLQKWSAGEKPKMAGVSSFGFGGTNAHLILEEAPSQFKIQNSKFKSEEFIERPCHILTLSGKCENALQELAQRYQEFLGNNSTAAIADICFTANTGRSHFKHRLAVVAESTEKLRQQLNGFETGVDTPGVVRGPVTSKKPPKIVFLFTGQGSQYVDMGRELYETQPTFRKTLEQCDGILRAYQQKPLLSVLYPEPGETSPIDETAYTQPALFAIEYALFELWKSWGIEPDVVMGHSVGEYVAACVAGVFSLEDGLKLIAHRGRLMQELPPDGKMVAVLASLSQVQKAIEPYAEKVAIAAINGPMSLVISGQRQAIDAVCANLKAEGVKIKPLQVSHAFHSPLMEAMLGSFEAVAQEVTYSQLRIKLISNLTGQPATAEIATPDYWCRHVTQPVQFAASMETLHQQGYEVFLECGPKPILLGMGRQCLPEGVGVWLPSLRPRQQEWQQLLHSLAQLYMRGVSVDWSGFDRDYPCQKIVLPTYPFQRQRYWIETNIQHHKKQFLSKPEILYPLLGQKLHLAGLEQQIRFESLLSASEPAYLSHHRIFDKAILPATAYFEMALEAGAAIFKSDSLILEDVIIQQALVLPEDKPKTIQLILTPSGTGAYTFEILSLSMNKEQEKRSWTLHASGKVLQEEKETDISVIDLSVLQEQYTKKICVENYYQQLQERGMNYGSSFQAVEKLWSKEGFALSLIQLDPDLASGALDYKLHPVFLDASCHPVGALLFDSDSNSHLDTYLPVELKRLRLYRCSDTRLWSQLQLRSITGVNQEILTMDLCLFDDHGAIVAQLEGFANKRTNHKALLQIIQKQLKEKIQEGRQLELLQKLEKASTEERQQILVTYLQEQVTKVLHLDTSYPPDPEQSINELGFDSLTGIELISQVERQLGLTISASKILIRPSIIELAKELAEQLLQESFSSESTDSPDGMTDLFYKSTYNWIAYHQPIPNARVRLFCFHDGGGNASIFQKWLDPLSPDIEVCPIKVPRGAERIGEQPFTKFFSLIETLEQVLFQYLDKPFAFYSHSAGNLIAFELAHVLSQNYGLEPIHLFVSGFWAPHAAATGMEANFFTSSDEEMKKTFIEILEVPQEYIHHNKFVEKMLPILNADKQLFQSYTYSKKEPLNCSISAFGGIEDPLIGKEDLLEWHKYTRSTFKLKMLPGKHMFLRNSRKLLLESISQELMASLNMNYLP